MRSHRSYEDIRTDQLEPLLSIREAAALLGVSPQTAGRLVHAGELAAVRVGKRRLLVSPSSLREFIDRRSGTRSR